MPEKPTPSIKFLGRNIFEHMLLHLKKIRSAELENSLMFLNQKQCFSLLFYLEYYLRNGIEIEISSRAIIYIIKNYQVQLNQSSQTILQILKSIALHMKLHFKNFRDDIGENVCALKIVSKEIKSILESGNDFDFN
jgi:hypothetical protein